MSTSVLPRGGVSLRFWVEPLGPHTQREPGTEPKRVEHGRQDLCDCLPHFRWALIFSEAGEIRGFKTEADFRAYCFERFGVTVWTRDWTGDWTPEDGDSWISERGELWPGRVVVGMAVDWRALRSWLRTAYKRSVGRTIRHTTVTAGRGYRLITDSRLEVTSTQVYRNGTTQIWLKRRRA